MIEADVCSAKVAGRKCGGRLDLVTENRFRRVDRCVDCKAQYTTAAKPKAKPPRTASQFVGGQRREKAEAKRARKAELRVA